MSMQITYIDGAAIHDRNSFHDEFARKLGFPSVYGRSMDAWIECLTAAGDDGGTMTIAVAPGDTLVIHVNDYATFKQRCPELAEELNESAACVNARRIDRGEQPVLALSYVE